MELSKYQTLLSEEVDKLYKIASEARKKGYDPTETVEVIKAEDTPERVEKILNLKGLEQEIRSLFEKGKDKIESGFVVAKKILSGEFGNFPLEKGLELALRAGLAVMTDCVTASPLEGISGVKVKNNFDNSKYLAVYYLGPIRTAGGTEAGLSVILADYLRNLAHLDRYKPTEDEVFRYMEEMVLYQRGKGKLQQYVTGDELKKLLDYLPVEVTGPASEENVEVTFYRDLKRVETNGIRGGALIVLGEGLLLKAKKLLPIVKKLKMEVSLKGWDWLSEFIKKEEQGNSVFSLNNVKYLDKLAGGRPIFSMPNSKWGFRLRYGRARNTGFAGVGLNPATMYLLDQYLAIGTQIKTEKPGKAAIVTPVSSIEGPFVLLKNNSLLQVNTLEEAKLLEPEVKEIISLGDILISIGDFLENNSPLLPCGLNEEWWVQELEEALKSKVSISLSITKERIFSFINNPYTAKPSPEEAWEISTSYKIPLHPKYLFNWQNLTLAELKELKEIIKVASTEKDSVVLSYSKKLIDIFQKLLIPYSFKNGQIKIQHSLAYILFRILNSFTETDIDQVLKEIKINPPEKLFSDTLNFLSQKVKFPFYPKGVTFIGARMGRPEKSKSRVLKPPVHILFPVGECGGRERSLNKAFIKGYCKIKIKSNYCPSCKLVTPYNKCDFCGSPTLPARYCLKCKSIVPNETCPNCDSKTIPYSFAVVNLRELIELSLKKLGLLSLESVGEVKGVKGLMNKSLTPEYLAKGILRAKYKIFVNKDGTCRFDAVNAPLTHFKPKEIGLPIEKAHKLGYLTDYKGKPLVSENQLCELFVQDVILPREAAAYFVNVANFIDELLEKIYGMEPYYNISKDEDLIGHIVFGISPHTFVAITGRVIGFTDSKVQYAHPVFHAAKRRNCDGDEDSFILGLDAFINFSREYIPSKVGGKEDVPLLFLVKIDMKNVDDEVYSMEISNRLPLKFYRSIHSREALQASLDGLRKVGDILDSEFIHFPFTHETSSIQGAPLVSRYKNLGLESSMFNKIIAQLELAKKLKGVSVDTVASLLIESHFLPDIIGNLRNFTQQSFRCVVCNRKYRRPPLSGKCVCGGKLILNTPKGGVLKYVEVVQYLIDNYKVPSYLKERFRLLKEEINQLFAVEFKNKESKGLLEEFL